MSLKDIDDEMKLVDKLQVFCRLRRKEVEVYFDQAPAGFAALRKFGQVKAYFVRQGTTADEAIRARLVRSGKGASNFTVVSSDRQVQASARAARASFISSEAFATELINLSFEKSTAVDPDRTLSADEVADWEELFRKRPGNASRTPGNK